MNWTSTKVPLWQTDCETFRTVGRRFELRDVATTAHEEFVPHSRASTASGRSAWARR